MCQQCSGHSYNPRVKTVKCSFQTRETNQQENRNFFSLIIRRTFCQAYWQLVTSDIQWAPTMISTRVLSTESSVHSLCPSENDLRRKSPLPNFPSPLRSVDLLSFEWSQTQDMCRKLTPSMQSMEEQVEEIGIEILRLIPPQFVILWNPKNSQDQRDVRIEILRNGEVEYDAPLFQLRNRRIPFYWNSQRKYIQSFRIFK